MRGLTIGEVTRLTGLRPSTLRYYEKAGLLPAPPRISKRRNYDPSALGRIRMVQIARSCGFSIVETRRFMAGFPAGTKPSARWQTLAERKRRELDALIDGARKMKALLDEKFRCGCATIDDCADKLAQRRS